MTASTVLAGVFALPPAHAANEDQLLDGIRLDDPKTIQTALLRGADPNAKDPKFGPMLVSATMQKSFKAARALLQTPETRVDAANERGETALMLAALHGNLDMVKLLVAKGAEVNKPDWTPLHYAATNGHLEVVRFLIENHAYVDAISPNKTTPLMMASRQNQIEIAKLLVEEGADPTQRNESGLTAAEYFLRRGEKDQAKWFADRAREYEAKYGTVDKPKLVRPAEAGGSDACKPNEVCK